MICDEPSFMGAKNACFKVGWSRDRQGYTPFFLAGQVTKSDLGRAQALSGKIYIFLLGIKIGLFPKKNIQSVGTTILLPALYTDPSHPALWQSILEIFTR